VIARLAAGTRDGKRVFENPILQLPKQTLYDKMKRLQVQGADYRNAS